MCQADTLTTVLLSVLLYPLHVGIIYLRLLQKIALYIGTRTHINLALHTNIIQIRIQALRISEDTCFLLDTKF